MRLSSLKPHPCHSVELEQYPTEGNLAAAWLTKIHLGDSFEGKHVLDLGANIDCSSKNLLDFSIMGASLFLSLIHI